MTLLKKSRPWPSKNDSQRSMTCPSGAESAADSSSLAMTKACSTTNRWSGVRESRSGGSMGASSLKCGPTVPRPAL